MKNKNSLKLSCADYAFPLLRHEVVFDLIKGMKFGGINIGLFEGRSHLQPSECISNPRSNSGFILENCRKRNLTLAELFLTPGRDVTELAINHPSKSERLRSREIFMKILDFADLCQPSCFDLLPGIDWPEDPRGAWECCVAELNWRIEIMKGRNYPLTIEPHVGSIVESPERVLKLLKEVPGMGLSLDYAHFAYQGYADDAVEVLLPHARHLHARNACKNQIQAVEADNTIDYSRICPLFHEMHPSDWICVEYVWMDKWDCNRVDNISESILLKNQLSQSVASNSE